MKDEMKPVNCATAEADIRVLNSEKVHVAHEIEAGVTAIVPIGLLVGVVTRTEGEKIEIATENMIKCSTIRSLRLSENAELNKRTRQGL
jgi:hypothetical protein